MSDDCAYPNLAPSTGYKNGCRCGRCYAWRRAKDLEHRERLNAYKRAARKRQIMVMPAPMEIAPREPRSATTIYNDILDWWDGL